MTQPSITDQQAIRLELLAAINFGIDYGLPAPKEISFSIETPHIDLDSAADLCGWADWLGYTGTIPATFGQPASHLDDPIKADRWLTNVYFDWRGTTICLGAIDPITPDQAQHWIDSGAAARHADRIAAQSVADPVDETPAEVARPVDFVDGPCGDPECPNASWPHLASNDLALPVTVYFSFGYGQTDPDTGKNLIGYYVTIVGPSHEACRAAMMSSRFGNRWSFDYLAGSPQADKWIPQWIEHERIILPADAPGEPECSPACDDQDGDLPHLADCPARPAAEVL